MISFLLFEDEITGHVVLVLVHDTYVIKACSSSSFLLYETSMVVFPDW